MFEFLIAAQITLQNPIIEIKEEPITEQVEEVKELTVEEKIASNYYKCDESIQYIRADTAECLAKPVHQTPKAQKTVRTAVRGSSPSLSWWGYKQCTWYVATRRNVGQWNNASEWLWQARRDGYATGSTPQVGAIAWERGHVSYVESVSGDNVTVSEYNYATPLGYGTRTVPASSFIYIY